MDLLLYCLGVGGAFLQQQQKPYREYNPEALQEIRVLQLCSALLWPLFVLLMIWVYRRQVVERLQAVIYAPDVLEDYLDRRRPRQEVYDGLE